MKTANLDYLFNQFGEVLTVKEVASTIRASESHVLRMIHSDELPCFQVGRHYRILKPDAVACLRKSP